MKIDTTALILDFNGKPIVEGTHELTLRDVIQRAVAQLIETDKTRTGEEKARLGQCGLKANRDDAEFSVEEIAALKRRIGEIYAPFIVARAYEILDPGILT